MIGYYRRILLEEHTLANKTSMIMINPKFKKRNQKKENQNQNKKENQNQTQKKKKKKKEKDHKKMNQEMKKSQNNLWILKHNMNKVHNKILTIKLLKM